MAEQYLKLVLLQDERQLRNIVEAAIQGDGEDDEEKLIAERRARRQAILEKHQKQKEETGKMMLPLYFRGMQLK